MFWRNVILLIFFIFKMQHYFDIAGRPNYDHIIEAIDDDEGVKYCDRKTRRKAHFKKVYGNDKNLERALNNPHSGVNAEDWKQCINLWLDEKVIKRAENNVKNALD